MSHLPVAWRSKGPPWTARLHPGDHLPDDVGEDFDVASLFRTMPCLKPVLASKPGNAVEQRLEHLHHGMRLPRLTQQQLQEEQVQSSTARSSTAGIGSRINVTEAAEREIDLVLATSATDPWKPLTAKVPFYGTPSSNSTRTRSPQRPKIACLKGYKNRQASRQKVKVEERDVEKSSKTESQSVVRDGSGPTRVEQQDQEEVERVEREQVMAHHRREVANKESEVHRMRAREAHRRRELRVAERKVSRSESLELMEHFDEGKDGLDSEGRGKRMSFVQAVQQASAIAQDMQRDPKDPNFLGREILAQVSDQSYVGSGQRKSMFQQRSSFSGFRGVSGFHNFMVEKGEREAKAAIKMKDRIKFKSSKDDRMKLLSKSSKRFNEQTRLQRLLETRRAAFGELPVEEQDCLRKAFLACDKDESGALDQREIKKGLVELGLSGKTDNEKKEVAILIQEATVVSDIDFYTFSFQFVPEVREKLMALRREQLWEQFCAYDVDGSGLLDEDECAEIIEKLCSSNMDSQGADEIQKHSVELFDTVKQAETGEVDFDGFEILIGRVREKHERVKKDREQMVIDTKKLDYHLINRHKEELLTLNETFDNQDHDGSGGLDDKEIVGALMEYGLMPKEPLDRKRIENTVKEVAEARGPEGMNFHDFLWVLQHVREEARQAAQYDLRKMFERADADKSGNLSLQEVSMLIVEIGLTPRCREDQDEIKKLLQTVDADGSGELDFKEFQELTMKITEKMRSGLRRRENETAKMLGFSPKQTSDLRDVFFQLDENGNGELSIEECRITLQMLRKNMSSEELHDVFNGIDRNGSGQIDFEEFLHFWKTVEDPEFRLHHLYNRGNNQYI